MCDLCFYVQVVMDQLNPGLRNLVNLGKSYEKAVTGAESTRQNPLMIRHLRSHHTTNCPVNSGCFSPSRAAMTLAGKAYFEAVSKLGENAVVSLVSRELGEFHAGPGSIVGS